MCGTSDCIIFSQLCLALPFEDGSSYNVNESWVLPAISKLNGRPEVAQNGQIVYVFDDLQTTAGDTYRKPPAILEEQEIPFSRADDGNLMLVGLLGVVNLLGAAYLGAQFAGLGAVKLVGFLGTVKTVYPALLTYAFSFFAAPAWRFFGLGKQNAEIQKRNQNRPPADLCMVFGGEWNGQRCL